MFAISIERKISCLTAIGSVWLLLAWTHAFSAQVHPAESSAAVKQQFEVATVRQNKSEDKATSNLPLTVGRNFSPTGGAFYARNQPLFV